MALTRKFLKGMNLTEEQIDSVIDAHTETVDALKDRITALQADADKLKDVQRELDDLKAGTDWKAEHDKVKKELDDYRSEIAGKEQAAKVKAAYKQLLTDEKIDPRRHDAIIRATDLAGAKLNKDGKLEGEDKLREGIRESWSDFVVTTGARGAHVATPPMGGKTTRTKEEIMAIKDTAERQQAMLENHEMFGF